MGHGGSQCCKERDDSSTELAGVGEAGVAPPGLSSKMEADLAVPKPALGTQFGGGGGETLMHHEMSYEDSSTYKGQAKDGYKRHGHGVWSSEAGTYEGQWQDDEQHGLGKQIWADGRSFEGQFERGMFSGQGRMEWKTPQGLLVYEGQYDKDKKHGQGKFVWPDGRSYDGQWANGRRNGKAVYVNSAGVERTGVWKDDKLERWTEA